MPGTVQTSSTIPDPQKIDKRTGRMVMARAVQGARMGILQLVHEFFGDDVLLDKHQADIIKTMIQGMADPMSPNSTLKPITELAIKGAASTGKGAAVAAGVVMWFELCPTCRILLTSPKYENVKAIMLGEIKKWRDKLTFRPEGQEMEEEIRVSDQKFIRCLNPKVEASFAGHHSPYSLLVADEASDVREQFWDVAMSWAKLRVALSNPRSLTGFFHRMFDDADDPDKTQTIDLVGGTRRRLITVDGARCRNVIEREEVIPGQLSYERYTALCAHPDPDYVDVYARGKSPREDRERMLVLRSWLARHTQAWKQDCVPIEAVAVDVADSVDGDETVLAVGNKDGIARMFTRQMAGTMGTVGWILRTLRKRCQIDLKQGAVPICVDADGVGKGVADRLEELGCWVVYHRGAAGAVDKQSYVDTRAETWGELAVRLNPDGPWGHTPFAMPPDGKLMADLLAQRKVLPSDGTFRFKLLKKQSRDGSEDLRKILGRSPDRGDTVAYLWCAVRAMWAEEAIGGTGDMFTAGPDEEGLEEGEFEDLKARGEMLPDLEEIISDYDNRQSWDDWDDEDL